MARATARPTWAIMVTAFVACVWLNQGLGPSEWAAYQQRVFRAPAANALDTLRYPFTYLYSRAADERLYCELSNMMLGRPADHEFVKRARGRLAPAFIAPFPPTDGKWHRPYVEVPTEYPIMALPFVLGPRLLVSNFHEFGFAFSALMGLCLVGAVVAALDAARACGVDARGLRARAWLAAGLLLAQGAMAVQRLDAVTALWIALAVRAAVRRRPLAFGTWAGLATATKIVPALIVPALLAADARAWRRPRTTVRFAIGFSMALVAGLGPMFVESPRAMAGVISYHAARGLHCESTLGLILATMRLAVGARASATLSYGSFNLEGSAADALATTCGPLSVAASVGLAWLIWRGAKNVELSVADTGGAPRVACAAFAALIVLWLTGKVFSPQYMTWGLPVVLAIPGAFGLRLSWLLLAAMAATQFYVCGHSELVVQGRALGLLNLGVRQAILALAAYLAAQHLVRRRQQRTLHPYAARSLEALSPIVESHPPP
jgi:hypothetical protein